LTVATVDPLERAVQLMVEHEVSRPIVVEQRSMRPIGVVSTLDIARALAGYTEPWAQAHDPCPATHPLFSERKEIRQ
jgi:CBS domain-containing protein